MDHFKDSEAMQSPFHGLFEELKKGLPELIMELPNSWVVLGELQKFRGHTVIIFKEYVVELHHLPQNIRTAYLEEVTLVSEAIQIATGCHKLNIESLGNQIDHLHTHVFPRYVDEDPESLKQPVWDYPVDERARDLSAFELMQVTATIRSEMMQLLGKYQIDLPGFAINRST